MMTLTDLDELLGSIARSVGQPNLRDVFFGLMDKALDWYAAIRLSDDQRDEYTLLRLRSGILGSLWLWSDYLTRSQHDAIGKRVTTIHVRSSANLVQVSRTEFAFLTGWYRGLEWAKEFNIGLLSSYQGLIDDLADLITSREEEEVIRAFFGLGSGSTHWERRRVDHDADDVRAELGMTQSYYERDIAPSQKEIYEDLFRFLAVCLTW